MKQFIANYLSGKFTLSKSFWFGCVIIPFVVALPFIPLYISSETDTITLTGFYKIYRILSYFFLILLFIGAFFSALKYIKNKKDNNQGYGLWGVAVIIYIVCYAIQITITTYGQLF